MGGRVTLLGGSQPMAQWPLMLTAARANPAAALALLAKTCTEGNDHLGQDDQREVHSKEGRGCEGGGGGELGYHPDNPARGATVLGRPPAPEKWRFYTNLRPTWGERSEFPCATTTST